MAAMYACLEQDAAKNKKNCVLVFPSSLTLTHQPFMPGSVSSGLCEIVHDSHVVGHVACRRRWGDVSGRGRTPPQWLPTPRWTIALTALAGNFLFQRWACGQRKRLKWRQAARAAWSPASLSRSGTGTLTSWLPPCISRPMCSAEVLSFCPWNVCPRRLSGQALRCM
jgi:hypothetical protein